MGLTIFNTLSRELEPFTPLAPATEQVRLYCCGPTVHNFAHIGNFRTFIFADLLRRVLQLNGFNVLHVMNVTDVEDKTIAAAQTSQSSLSAYTRKYEDAFFEDFTTLRCLPPAHTPRATEHIQEILDLISLLMKRGFAYRASDGSIYFNIGEYRAAGRRYGQLLNLNFEKLRIGERVSADEYDKESVVDFALWKARTPADGSIFWPSPWGEGRPGWHIECSAMSMKLLGESFDIHAGGEDLIFPHHEDEIAQSEGARDHDPDRPFVKYWVHAAHLLVEGKKMSKSLGNFFTLRDLLDKGFSGREIRYLLLTSHYRESFNFTLDGLTGARTALQRIDDCLLRLSETAGPTKTIPEQTLVDRVRDCLNDDLNVSAAWGAVFEWIRDANRKLDSQELSSEQAAAKLAAWNAINEVFDVAPDQESGPPAEFLALLEERQAARKSKDFKRADAIRDQLKGNGWIIEDTPKGPRLKKA